MTTHDSDGDPDQAADADGESGADSGTGTDSNAGGDVPWTDITDADDAGDEQGGPEAAQVIAGATAVIDPTAYCQQCPHFETEGGPNCTHEGTRILEVLPDGRCHVIDCPVVTAAGPDFTRVRRD
jgi:hypothetical protein